ncbi:MAG: UDP-N-acetylmuramate--L-alanine ligase [Gammaproteobacteria bacterium]|jgi:UDP-N-acetylmuramate--alanine ligase|nr:UDP-N-acetylmuramate--L-alanine ligase [Gammaproteobacteria bacterium]
MSISSKAQSSMMRRIRGVHLVGIGGSGMSGIAEVLLNLGFAVSGSDLRDSKVTRRLRELGAQIQIGHRAENLVAADVVVVSSAVPADNPELQRAHDLRLPVVQRAEMLAELMRFREGIAVAGTHGKTTTTSLTAGLLAEAGLDPTFIIGGLVHAFGSHARLGDGRYLIAEADESDGSFLLLQPVLAVVTNIDQDHLENYGNSFTRLRQAFIDFLHHLPFYGVAVLCTDDAEVARLLPEVKRSVLSFGINESADVRASNIRQDGRCMHFDVHLPGRQDALPMQLNLPGLHNVRNALGAIAVAHELGIAANTMQQGLLSFRGIGRRFEHLGDLPVPDGHAGKIEIIEDYGHHPTELEATLRAAREGWPKRRLVAVFQPHRYSRTQALFDEFVRVLSGCADMLIICEIYPAGEAPIDGVDSGRLCQSIRSRGKTDPMLMSGVDELQHELPALLQADDLLLLLGAGDIGALGNLLLQAAAQDAQNGPATVAPT